VRAIAMFVTLAALLSACAGPPDNQRFPRPKDYPPGVMANVSYVAGGETPWKLNALETPNSDAPWKMVVITGTPSWSEFWAPTLGKAPPDLQIVAADRPGFALSEPHNAVPDIAMQAAAMAPLLDGPEGQKVVIVGQSYGAPVATLMAYQHPEKVKALVLMSSFYGEWGVTARRLKFLGGFFRGMLPRDLKNGLDEIKGQAGQLPAARKALGEMTIPVIVVQGDDDSFVPPAFAEALAQETNPASEATIVHIPKGDHFLNACCVSEILAAARTVMDKADARAGAEHAELVKTR
jgi:pimeloyl-ACP methyl ester carboxylesterase